MSWCECGCDGRAEGIVPHLCRCSSVEKQVWLEKDVYTSSFWGPGQAKFSVSKLFFGCQTAEFGNFRDCL